MRFYYILAILLSLQLLATPPAAASQVRIRFSHVVAPESPKGKAAEYFKRLVEERSSHRIQVEIFPQGILFDDSEVLEALRNNEVQLAAPSLSKLSGFDVQLQLFDLPFLFRDDDHLHQVIDGQVGQRLLAEASHDGLVALSFWDNGFKQLTANRSLSAPGAAAGLTMRIEGSAVQKAQFEELGAKTRKIPFPHLYASLRDGIADGQENTLSNIYNQRLYEVQSSLTISNHGYLEYLVLSNTKFWNELPEDLRVIIRGAIKDAAAYTREMASKLNEQALQKLADSTPIRIHRLSPEEKNLWQKRLQVLYPRFAAEIGPELIQKAQDAGLR